MLQAPTHALVALGERGSWSLDYSGGSQGYSGRDGGRDHYNKYNVNEYSKEHHNHTYNRKPTYPPEYMRDHCTCYYVGLLDTIMRRDELVGLIELQPIDPSATRDGEYWDAQLQQPMTFKRGKHFDYVYMPFEVEHHARFIEAHVFKRGDTMKNTRGHDRFPTSQQGPRMRHVVGQTCNSR